MPYLCIEWPIASLFNVIIYECPYWNKIHLEEFYIL
jgi:hypothetical protein